MSEKSTAAPPPVREVLDAAGAARLAAELATPTRTRAKIVVTSPADRRPVIDVAALAAAVGERAEVVLVAGAFRPPEPVRPGTVPPGYDTAQVHPVSGRSAPLRVASSLADRSRVLQELLADVEALEVTRPHHHRAALQSGFAGATTWPRAAGRRRPVPAPVPRPGANGDETPFRIAVHQAWARRFLTGGEAGRLPGPYALAPAFLPSLAEVGSADVVNAVSDLVADLLHTPQPSPVAIPRTDLWLEHTTLDGTVTLERVGSTPGRDAGR